MRRLKVSVIIIPRQSEKDDKLSVVPLFRLRFAVFWVGGVKAVNELKVMIPSLCVQITGTTSPEKCWYRNESAQWEVV